MGDVKLVWVKVVSRSRVVEGKLTGDRLAVLSEAFAAAGKGRVERGKGRY